MFAPRSVLVTGANSGIGLEFVQQFLKLQPAPCHVFAGCRSPEKATELKRLASKYPTITIVKIDLNDTSNLEEVVKLVDSKTENKGLNLLINNAGVASAATIDDVTPEEMLDLYRVNAVGPLCVAKAFIPLLKTAAKSSPDSGLTCSRAAIINISSGVASITENDTSGMYPYRASKAALNMITKNLSLDLNKDGIFVTAVHPGWVKTEMGGPRAVTETSESVATLIKLMTTFSGEGHAGKLVHYSGRVMAF